MVNLIVGMMEILLFLGLVFGYIRLNEKLIQKKSTRV